MADKQDDTPQQPAHTPGQAAPAPATTAGTQQPPQQPHHGAQGYHGKLHSKHAAHSNPEQGQASPASASSGAATPNAPSRAYQGNANPKYYNNKRNSYSQKINTHNNQYAGGYAFTPNMYGGAYYYPYPYPQGMVPGMNMPGYSQLPQQVHSPLQQYPTASSPGVSKVKITDKEGNLVDLEKKSSASTSATSTPGSAHAQVAAVPAAFSPSPAAPAASLASPVSAPSSASPAAAAPATPAAPADPNAPPKLSAAEEFRRKILEKAQIAQKKKDEEKAKAAAAKEQAKSPAPAAPAAPAAAPATPAPAAAPVAAPAAPAAAPAPAPAPAPVASTPAPAPVTETHAPEPAAKAAEPVAEPAAEPVAEPAAKAAEPVAPAPASEPVAQAEEPAAPAKEAEPAAESTPEAKSTPEPLPEKTETQEETPVSKSVDEEPEATTENVNEDASAEDTSAATEADAEDDNEDKAADADDSHVDDEDAGDDESVFDLSLYFNRLATANPIDDPFSFSYPYPLTGVDLRWKAGLKKYRYDPQFLLQFRDFVQYPIDDAWKEKLEGLGIVPNKRSGSGSSLRMNPNRVNLMTGGRFNGSLPGRMGQFDGRQNSRGGSKRRGGSSAGGPRDKSLRNRNQSKRGGRERDEEPPKPAEEVKPLVPSANRWVPRSRAKNVEVKLAPDGTPLLDTEDIERKTKSALNKLTLEMFEPITEDLLTIAKQSIHEDDAKTIKQVITLTFAKACDEPYWSTVYAQFCAKMLKDIPEEIKDVNTLTKSGEPATGGDLARRLLLTTCQTEYEKGWVDKLPTNPDGSPLEPEMMSDEYYQMAAAKRRGLGLVKFIGNLYILNMLNDQVILHCLRDQSKNVVDPSEDSLENLAQLIKTVGPRFETSERNKAALSMIYDNIQQILENCKLSSRIKFMLMDLQDLRKSNWRSGKQESGPKTIKEIHNEAELKRIEEGRAQAEKRRQNKGSYNNSGYGGGDSRSNSTRGGSNWGSRKDNRDNRDNRGPSKDSRGFTSVPRSQSNRPTPDTSMNASQMSPRENSKRTDSMASNIFAALDGDDDDHDAGAN